MAATLGLDEGALKGWCTEMPPHTVMLLVVQSLSTELGLSPRPGAPELLTQTWQILGESRLFLKVLQPRSLRVIGMPSGNRDTAHFLPTAAREPIQPPPNRQWDPWEEDRRGARWQPDRGWRGRSQPSQRVAGFHTPSA